jgi:hypothetical protein
MEKNPESSDSVNAMNGCLVGCLRFFWQVFACVLIITLAPYVGILFLIWWPIAWILGLVFPGREFFPIKRIWAGTCGWIKRNIGIELDSFLLITALSLFIVAAVDVVFDLFRGKN